MENPPMLFIFASIFHYKIDNIEQYSLATDIATSFACFKSQNYTRKSSFFLFLLWSGTL